MTWLKRTPETTGIYQEKLVAMVEDSDGAAGKAAATEPAGEWAAAAVAREAGATINDYFSIVHDDNVIKLKKTS